MGAESPENEATFWRYIYPRLLPSSVNVLALEQQRDALLRPANPEEVCRSGSSSASAGRAPTIRGLLCEGQKARATKIVSQPDQPCSKMEPLGAGTLIAGPATAHAAGPISTRASGPAKPTMQPA